MGALLQVLCYTVSLPEVRLLSTVYLRQVLCKTTKYVAPDLWFAVTLKRLDHVIDSALSPFLTVAMSLDPPAYILSLQNNIRARPISWEGAVRAKTITEQDLKKIKAIDKVRKEQRKQTIEAEPDSYVALLVGSNESQSIFQSAAKRTDILQYMLVLTGDLIDGSPRPFSTLSTLHPIPSSTPHPHSFSLRHYLHTLF